MCISNSISQGNECLTQYKLLSAWRCSKLNHFDVYNAFLLLIQAFLYLSTWVTSKMRNVPNWDNNFPNHPEMKYDHGEKKFYSIIHLNRKGTVSFQFTFFKFYNTTSFLFFLLTSILTFIWAPMKTLYFLIFLTSLYLPLPFYLPFFSFFFLSLPLTLVLSIELSLTLNLSLFPSNTLPFPNRVQRVIKAGETVTLHLFFSLSGLRPFSNKSPLNASPILCT